jgi:hypothetical protein
MDRWKVHGGGIAEPCDQLREAGGAAADRLRRYRPVQGLLAAATIRLYSAVASSWDRSSGQART